MSATAVTVEELAGAEGRDLGSSGWVHIDQSRIDLFADATDDHQWIHVDPDKAADGPFGATIAHGYLTLSLIPLMLDEILEITDQARGTNYGFERVRFTNPVRVGSQIRLTASVSQAIRRDDGGVRFAIEFRVDIRDEERPALIGEAIYVSYDR